MPKALESDTLLANCTWQAIDLYNKDPDRNVAYLEISLRHCCEIGNAILKQGILSLLWHSHICKRLAALTEFIDRVIYIFISYDYAFTKIYQITYNLEWQGGQRSFASKRSGYK